MQFTIPYLVIMLHALPGQIARHVKIVNTVKIAQKTAAHAVFVNKL